MPYNRGRKKGFRRAGRKRTRVYGTKPSFMPKTLAIKRYNNISTKTFYFKEAGTIASDQLGNVIRQWNTLAKPAPAFPNNPLRLPQISDINEVAELYNEYKILAVKVRIFSADVGTESNPPPANSPPFAGFLRGSSVMYLDQKQTRNEQIPDQITQVMTYGSARMIPSRCSKFTKVMYRPKGYPKWGTCDRNVPVSEREPDPWFASVNLLGNFATPNQNPLWFYTVSYKIIFRGRTYTQP